MKRHIGESTVELTPFRPYGFPTKGGPEAGSGLRCIGHFALNSHLLRYRNHPMKPPGACMANLICELAEQAGLERPDNSEEALAETLAKLPSPFPAGFPSWALAIKGNYGTDPETGLARHPSPTWPALAPAQGLYLLARTAGGLYLASREVVYDMAGWIDEPVAWFAPAAAWPGERGHAE